ncbi:unnamed protein product [Rhizoctonia solani]|uniref:Uncharacterized protein n=1 Tax=Rhizoctonia solani TaxID=456999 RepID=A0A8H3ARU2_9AGAM|nr:unnamed protein product [Rhizoctonia solani]
MSDLSFSPSPEPASSKSRKRKSKGSSTTQVAKKPRGRGKKSQPDPYETAKNHMESVLASPEAFDLPEDDGAIREMITTIVRYTKSLEGSVAVANRTGQDAPPLKTSEQIQEEASRIKKLINRGITKLMSWKPTCTEGRTKYAFEGVCPDSRVFGAVFGLDGPPVWVTKKYTVDEFENFVGHIRGEVRYASLYITSDVKVEYNHKTGEFTVSGKYGKLQPTRRG